MKSIKYDNVLAKVVDTPTNHINDSYQNWLKGGVFLDPAGGSGFRFSVMAKVWTI